MSSEKIKLAVPSMGDQGLDAELTTRFGRCAYFTIVTIEEKSIKEVEVIENPGINARGGAGPMAAQLVAKEGATAIIGGNYGPNAMSALNSGNIARYGADPSAKNVKNIVQLFIEGKLSKLE